MKLDSARHRRPITADFTTFEPPCTEVSPEANEFNWSAISQADYDYLTGPRNYPAPCPWCGGQLHHYPLCDDLRASWEAVMPYGKHRGKKLAALPVDYLLWLAWIAGTPDGIGRGGSRRTRSP